MYLVAWLCFVLFDSLIDALSVTAGSPCSQTCNSANGTFWPDLVCADSDFSSVAKGQLLQNCLRCEGQSLYVNGTRSDEYWYMFHMKYSQQACLIDTDIPHSTAIQACATECAPLRKVLDTLWLSTTPFLPQYNYCTLDSNAYPTYAPKCGTCLQAQAGAVILGNMVQTMVNACVDQPLAVNGTLVTTTRDLFNTTVIPLASTTSPSNSSSTSSAPAQSTKPANGDGQGLTAAAAAGIGVGIAVLLIGAGIGALYFWRRRKRSNASNTAEEPVPVYSEYGHDKKHPKPDKLYREMHAEPARQELAGHETLEADSRPAGKEVPVAELPVTPYR